MEFVYSALDAGGNEKRGIVEADDELKAAMKIKSSGLFPTSIKEVNQNIPRVKNLFHDEQSSKNNSPEANVILTLLIILTMLLSITGILYSLNVGGYKYRIKYEDDVRETIRQMVNEGALKQDVEFSADE